MKKMLSTMTALLVAGVAAQAQTKSCAELEAEIAAKLDAAGVKGYELVTLDAKDPVGPNAKVVGVCERGAKKITYEKR